MAKTEESWMLAVGDWLLLLFLPLQQLHFWHQDGVPEMVLAQARHVVIR